MTQGQPMYTVNEPVKGTSYQKELQTVEIADNDLFK